ncbi:MAG: lipopolysaccharide biosynthesis protein [Fuerstiella sp.]
MSDTLEQPRELGQGQVDEASDSLGGRTVVAGLWTVLEQFGRRGLSVVVNLVLARLLLPHEFGLVGILTVFILVAQVIADAGLSSALIQKSSPSETDWSTSFYSNFILGLLIFAVLWVLSPAVAASFSEPQLTWLTRVLALTVVVNSLGVVQATRFQKTMNFRPLTESILISVFVSGVISIGLAIWGFGVWSLAIQRVLADLIRVTLFWCKADWVPSLKFSFTSLKEQVRYGGCVLLAAIFNTVTQPMIYFVIAAGHAPATLGYVVQGSQLPDALSRTLAGTLGRVAFPVFALIQQDRSRVKKTLRNSMQMLYSTVLPLMVIVAVSSPLLVQILLTEKWIPCVPYLRLFCVIGFLLPVQAIYQHLLMVDSRPTKLIATQFFRLALHAVVLLCTFRFGVLWIVTGQVIAELIVTVVLSCVMVTVGSYSLQEQLSDLFRPLAVVVLATSCVLLGQAAFELSVLPALLVQSVCWPTLLVILAFVFKLPVLETLQAARARRGLVKIAAQGQ